MNRKAEREWRMFTVRPAALWWSSIWETEPDVRSWKGRQARVGDAGSRRDMNEKYPGRDQLPLSQALSSYGACQVSIEAEYLRVGYARCSHAPKYTLPRSGRGRRPHVPTRGSVCDSVCKDRNHCRARGSLAPRRPWIGGLGQHMLDREGREDRRGMPACV